MCFTRAVVAGGRKRFLLLDLLYLAFFFSDCNCLSFWLGSLISIIYNQMVWHFIPMFYLS
uniref:Uncharacterized protein n=1 Tax=Anguilla anguilla TaxID=7936 RepID=A0A0E9W1K6_ANGAN